MKAVSLHLNLDGIPEGFPMARTMSNSSVSSTPQTPVGQSIITPTASRQKLHRLNSVSSIATSEDEDSMSGHRPIDSFIDWNGADDDLLMSLYQIHIDNPTNAPFSGRLPPSGLVHQVAKSTLREAKHRGIAFPHSLNAVRKRLLLLCGRQADDDDHLHRKSSVSSTSSSPRYMRSSSVSSDTGTSFASAGSIMTPLASRFGLPNGPATVPFMLGSPADDASDQGDGDEPMPDSNPLSPLPMPPVLSEHGPRSPKVTASGSPIRHSSHGMQPMQLFNSPPALNRNMHSLQHPHVPQLFPNSPPEHPVMRPTPGPGAGTLLFHTPLGIHPSTPDRPSHTATAALATPAPTPIVWKPQGSVNPEFDFGLAPPFRPDTSKLQPAAAASPTKQSYDIDPLMSITAQRKRDSLRMKRGMKAT